MSEEESLKRYSLFFLIIRGETQRKEGEFNRLCGGLKMERGSSSSYPSVFVR
jgi:hypothetical protein